MANNVKISSLDSVSSLSPSDVVPVVSSGNTQKVSIQVIATTAAAISSASYTLSSNVDGPFGKNSVISASFAQTASYVATVQTASYVLNAQTASYVNTAQTASYVNTAQTASYVLNAVSSSYSLSSSFAKTASYVATVQTASYVLNAVSSSFAQTASYVLGGGAASTLQQVTDQGASTTNKLSISNKVDITGSLSNGYRTTTYADYSHAEGAFALANGYAAHAEGYYTTASGDYSHAEGNYTKAQGTLAHAEGDHTNAFQDYSHAEGAYSYAQGVASHAEGYQCYANGYGSHAEGNNTQAYGDYQHVMGTYNMSSDDQYAFIIGNGLNSGTRSNLAFASGSTFQITGSLSVSGSIKSSNKAITVSSNTASINLSKSNYFTVTLGANTHISASNINPGQSVNILITTDNPSAITFSSAIHISSAYVPTQIAGGKDLLTFVSFDNSNLYLSSYVKNFN